MIETRRLIMRPIKDTDLTWLRGSINDKGNMRYVLGIPKINDLLLWIRDDRQLKLIVINKDTCERIGIVFLTPFSTTVELGAWLDKAHQGLLYTREGLRGIESYLKGLKIHKLTATVIQGNGDLKKIMAHLGFGRLCVLKEHAWLRDKYISLDMYEKFIN